MHWLENGIGMKQKVYYTIIWCEFRKKSYSLLSICICFRSYNHTLTHKKICTQKHIHECTKFSCFCNILEFYSPLYSFTIVINICHVCIAVSLVVHINGIVWDVFTALQKQMSQHGPWHPDRHSGTNTFTATFLLFKEVKFQLLHQHLTILPIRQSPHMTRLLNLLKTLRRIHLKTHLIRIMNHLKTHLIRIMNHLMNNTAQLMMQLLFQHLILVVSISLSQSKGGIKYLHIVRRLS